MLGDSERKNSEMRFEEGSERKRLKEKFGVERRKRTERDCEKGARDESGSNSSILCTSWRSYDVDRDLTTVVSGDSSDS